MKRVQYNRYGGPDEMYLGDFTLPDVSEREVLISIKAAAINPFDWKIRQGMMKFVTGRRFPRAMGTDFSGVVEAVGESVTHLAAGDEVFGTIDFKKSGAFAEMAVVDAATVARKPARLSFSEAASLPVAAMTAWAAIMNRNVAGADVFINGCNGAVGSFAVQLAQSQGAHVAGACGPSSRSIAKAAGIDPVLAYSDIETMAPTAKFDVVFDTLGTLNVRNGLSMLKRTGVFVDINPTLGRVLRGVLSRRYKLAFATQGMKNLPNIAQLAADGVLRPTVGSEEPFSNAVAAISGLEAGRRAGGKIVLVI
ncbi:NAD(P)-dependent alcohol dehydrogenase [Roseibium suaedae]|uniref:NADPH:quinone reductase n=1 Tax=Roseibium suaedae TaxID=735517 RepID=A0A1M7F191_9HYPH|nr:NAD(P)-dependent alcohol dehydrogenase [Roseibium suaedae]SHL97497.1 NADPH:quinone reductase [Roseibium suaedae]